MVALRCSSGPGIIPESTTQPRAGTDLGTDLRFHRCRNVAETPLATVVEVARAEGRLGPRGEEMHRTNRWVMLVGAAAAVVAAQVGIQLAGAGPAAAVTGIEKVVGEVSLVDSQQTHTSIAHCPPGKYVIGGGGWAFAVAAADAAKVTLLQMRPEHRTDGAGDSYVVTGSETTPTMTGDWWVQAYAICASPSGLSGYKLESTNNGVTASPDRMETWATCGSGKRALGGGARITNPGREVALQMSRASATGDIFRAAAREDADGYSGDWTVDAYAVCVNQPAGYQVVTTPSTASDSESEKLAFAKCPAGTRVHGAGAAISNTAPGGVSLQVVYPYGALDQVQAYAVENTPTGQDWDFIVGQAICAS
jgi:hypothetical protein